ncbi:transcriptional regulator DEF1-like [Silurus meridionalis]|uniref:transcriptional regulator DEF1-like n=1 Tax=Silurus meridionalis TaxID=175797 RepID=UPI001EEC725E|nr:transcriptional regulator DEF1-like [Silurus meridionalis]
MENMPPPPYPGPPLESTDYVQQRPVIPELAPHQQCSSQEGGLYNHQPTPDHQNHRSLPAENMPAPPYPGPPLESTFTPQLPLYIQCSSQEQIPDPQNHRSLPSENMPAPPYPGPPLDSTGFVEQRSITPQSPSQRQSSSQAGGPYNNQQNPDPHNYRSLSTESMPGPPYPGPPLDSTVFVQQRSFTHQPAPQRQCSSQEGGPYNHRQTPDPQNYRSLPMESMPVPPYPGFSLPQRSPSPQSPLRQQYPVAEESYTHQHSPHPQHPCQNFESPGPQRVVYKEPTSHQAASYQHYEADVNQKVYAHSNLTCSKQTNRSFEKSMTSMQYEQAPNIKQKSSKEEMVYAVHEAAREHNMNMQADLRQKVYAHSNVTGSKQANLSFEGNMTSTQYKQPMNIKQCGGKQELVYAVHESPCELDMTMQCAASSSAMVATESRAFSMNKLRTSLEQNFSEAKYSAQKSTFEIAKQATEYTKVSAQKVALSQYSSNTQLAQAQTSASMYTQSAWNAVQPGVQVVQAGGTQVILPAQRQQVVIQPAVSRTIIQPVNPQPTVVIQNPSPTYRVIQPQVLPTVIQPAPSTVVYRYY